MSGNPMADDLARQMARIMTGEVALPPPPQVDPAVQQRLALEKRMYADRQREQMARIQAARAKAEAQEKERRSRLDAEQRERAEAYEETIRLQTKREFLASNGREQDWPQYWATRRLDIFDELAEQERQRLLNKYMPARNAF